MNGWGTERVDFFFFLNVNIDSTYWTCLFNQIAVTKYHSYIYIVR